MNGPYVVATDEVNIKHQSQPSKLTWFQRWFLKHSQQAWQTTQQLSARGPVGMPSRVASSPINTRGSIDMSLVRADGGWIVQFQQYDIVKDHNYVTHYVIADSEDLGSRLAEIITLQCLRA